MCIVVVTKNNNERGKRMDLLKEQVALLEEYSAALDELHAEYRGRLEATGMTSTEAHDELEYEARS